MHAQVNHSVEIALDWCCLPISRFPGSFRCSAVLTGSTGSTAEMFDCLVRCSAPCSSGSESFTEVALYILQTPVKRSFSAPRFICVTKSFSVRIFSSRMVTISQFLFVLIGCLLPSEGAASCSKEGADIKLENGGSPSAALLPDCFLFPFPRCAPCNLFSTTF
jgi:hypothetical protein